MTNAWWPAGRGRGGLLSGWLLRLSKDDAAEIQRVSVEERKTDDPTTGSILLRPAMTRSVSGFPSSWRPDVYVELIYGVRPATDQFFTMGIYTYLRRQLKVIKKQICGPEETGRKNLVRCL
jgi:hypothetical protein